MKKYNLYLWLLALVGLMTSCSQDETDALQTTDESNRVTIGASISEALQTRAASVTIPDGYKLRYVLEVWKNTESEFPPFESNRICRYEETMTDASGVNFKFTLTDAGNYNALLWADFIPVGETGGEATGPNSYTHYADNFYTTNTASGLKAVTLAKTGADYVINAAARDAFFGMIWISKEAEAYTGTVELKRPFGQINIIEKNAEQFSKVATMTLGYEVPSTFDCSIGGPQKELAQVSLSEVTPSSANNGTLFYDYIFASESGQTTLGNIKLTFTSNDPSVGIGDYTIPANIPVERNKRTNISGNIIHTSSGAANLTVTVSDGWEETTEEYDPDIINAAKAILDAAQESGGGNDAQNYTYTISTAEQLAALATLANNRTVITGCTSTAYTSQYRSANYKLTDNINLENEPWTPINNFMGTFDGQGHTISNMNVSITSTSDIDGGLFGYMSGTVSNLIVEGTVTVNGGGKCYTGGICGLLGGTIKFCRFNGTVSSTTTSTTSGNYAGGIMGDYIGAIRNITGCIANAKVTATGGKADNSGAGGLAGRIAGTDCKYSAWNSDASTGTENMIGKNLDGSTGTGNQSFTDISGLNNYLSTINSNVSGTYQWEAGDSNTDYPKLGKRSSSQPN